MANLSFNYFWITTLPNKPKILLLYRAPWHKGWAGHTSSTVQSELLLVIEYTTYMIVTCTQSPHCPKTLENKINLLEPKLYWRLTYLSLKVKYPYSVHSTFSYCIWSTAFYHQLPVKVCHILIIITLYTVRTASM